MSARAEKRARIVGTGEAERAWRDLIEAQPELVIDGEGDGDGTPHVAVVCSPTAERPQRSADLMRRGVDVLVEAPLGTALEDVERCVAQAHRLRRELLVASPGAFDPALRSARRALDRGRIGRLRSVEIAFGRKLDARSSWRGDAELSGGGVWMDLGPRALDAAECLAGPIRRIRMLAAGDAQRSGVEDTARVETEHEGGLTAGLLVSWNDAEPAPIARCSGEEGEIVLGTSRARLRSDAGETVLGPGYDPLEAARAALGALFARRCGRFTPRAGAASMLARLQAAYRSLRDTRWQPA